MEELIKFRKTQTQKRHISYMHVVRNVSADIRTNLLRKG